MRVGVTGAGGFIGRHLVTALAARGHLVRALVNRTAAAVGVETRPIDLARPGGFPHAIEGLDAIVHAAAHVPVSYADPDEARPCMEVNALGTLALLCAAERAGVRRFILVSGNIYRFGSEPVDEAGPIEPSGRAPYYLASKACADFFAAQFLREARLEVAILRPSAVYGPGLARGMIATFVECLERRATITVEDGGRYRADMVHVGDVAAAAVAALDRAVEGPFNIGAGVTASPLDVARALVRIIGAPSELIEVRPAAGAGVVGFSPLASARARRELGFAPRGLEEGLADYVQWWRRPG